MKKCSTCGEIKPHSVFHNLSSSEDGKQRRCKSCVLNHVKEYKTENKTKNYQKDEDDIRIEGIAKLKNCSICGERKLFRDFNINSAAKDGRNYWCKTCDAQKKQETLKEEPIKKTYFELVVERDAQRREEQKPQEFAFKNNLRQCNRCGGFKHVDDFYIYNSRKYVKGYKECNECHARRVKTNTRRRQAFYYEWNKEHEKTVKQEE